MACDLTRGIGELSCKNAVPGIKNIYVINYSENYDFVTVSTPSGHTLTSLGTLGTSGTTGAHVYKFATKNAGNDFKETSNSNRDQGTTSYSATLTLVLTKLSAEKQYTMKMLAWGRPIIVLEMNSGQFLMFGKDNGTEVTYVGGVTGADGLNGYTLTIASTLEKEPFFFLDASAVTALKLLISTDNILND